MTKTGCVYPAVYFQKAVLAIRSDYFWRAGPTAAPTANSAVVGAATCLTRVLRSPSIYLVPVAVGVIVTVRDGVAVGDSVAVAEAVAVLVAVDV